MFFNFGCVVIVSVFMFLFILYMKMRVECGSFVALVVQGLLKAACSVCTSPNYPLSSLMHIKWMLYDMACRNLYPPATRDNWNYKKINIWVKEKQEENVYFQSANHLVSEPASRPTIHPLNNRKKWIYQAPSYHPLTYTVIVNVYIPTPVCPLHVFI